MLRAVMAALAAVCLLALPAVAAEEKPAPAKDLKELDARLDAAFKSTNTVGASIVYVEDNKVVWRKDYGYADLAAKAPVTPQTLFRAGSITKTFTSLLAMTYVEEGKLDLNAKLADIAPDIGFDNPWEASAPVRFVNLLEHTTGWADLGLPEAVALFPEDSVDRALGQTRRLRVSRWQPNRYMAYSNVGVGVAGVILQRIGGAPYAQLVQNRVLAPMGIAGASFAVTPENRARVSKSYRADGVAEIPYHGIGLSAAGSLLITTDELAKLVMFMNARGAAVTGRPVVTPDSIARMEHPVSTLAAQAGMNLGYGLGVFYAPQDTFAVYGHNGAIDGFESAYVYWPEMKRGYVAVINGGAGNEKMLAEITRFMGRDYKPQLPPEAKPDAQAIAPYAGFYVPIAPRHNFTNALFQIVPSQVSVSENGRVNVLNAARVGAGGLTFRREERADPNLIFYTTPEGAREFAATTTVLRQLTLPELAVHAAIIVGFSVALVWSVLLLLVRFARLFVKRGERPATGVMGAAMRWLPMLSLFAFLGMFCTFAVAAGSPNQIELLGTPSPAALAIYYLSLATPVLAGLGLVAALAAPNGNGRLSRAAAIWIAAAMVGVSAWLYAQGWVGIQFYV